MIHALLKTLPGRALVIGLLVKAVVSAIGLISPLPSPLALLDTVSSITCVAAGVYFLGRAVGFVRRRVLWRVRRKLIISYIFVGVVPAILIAAFFLLGGLLLFSNFSSYLLQTRLQALSTQAGSVAATAAVEIQRAGGRDVAGILRRRERLTAAAYPGSSLAVVRLDAPCSRPPSADALSEPGARPSPDVPGGRSLHAAAATAGPWAHVEPPVTMPGWVACSGFQGLLAYGDPGESPRGRRADLLTTGPGVGRDVHLVARAVAFPDGLDAGYAVVVDLPVNASLTDRLRQDTGVELAAVRTVAANAPVLPARPRTPSDGPSSSVTAAPVSSVSFPEIVDWETGDPKGGVVYASMQLSIGEMYARISAAQGSIANRSFGQGLLLVLLVIGVLFFIIEVLALLIGLALARSITGSVHELFAGTERVRQGDFTHKIAIRARDQLGELAESFNSMTGSIENLLREQADKKRLEEELRIAHEIQMSLLPQGPLGVPGLSVTALSVPAREVGGDYYDFFPIGDDRVGILIADVSGKGTSAALYMAELKGLMLSLSQIHTSPRALLIAANGIIAPHLDARSFITMTYAVVDLRAHTMTYARAGHTPLIYLHAAGPDSRVRVLAPDGLVLGLKLDEGEMFAQVLCEETMTIHTGDVLLLFTDGITEAMDAADDCFGEIRLGRFLEEHAHLPGEELRERLLREVAAFVGDVPQHDDMTFLLLRIGETSVGSGAGRVEAEVAEVRA